jgi:DNA-directed RNA polymerase subunit beta'
MSNAVAVSAATEGPLAVRIRLASPDGIRGWSSGEVTSANSFDRTDRPFPSGLFCERIFGPVLDWCCACVRDGRTKYWGLAFRGQTCPRCGVTVDDRFARRRRMGHIELAVPVVHPWFGRSRPNLLALLLGMKPAALARVLAYECHVIVDPGETGLRVGRRLNDEQNRRARARHGTSFRVEMGARAVRALLQRLDLPELSRQLRREMATLEEGPRRERLLRRVRVVEAMRDSGNRPEWIVLDCLPVLPPDLRPVREIAGDGRAAVRVSSDLNFFYQRILETSNKIRKWSEGNAIEVILRHERRRLQQAVDALLDNARCDAPLLGSGQRPLRSLADLLQGKRGRFRQNLLGKRVDYSARAVITAGPELELNQCGLPRRIAMELFQPMLIGRVRRLFRRRFLLPGQAALLAAKAFVQDRIDDVRCVLEAALGQLPPATDRFLAGRDDLLRGLLDELLRGRRVLLNRAPTLHRMNIQAFEPVLTEDNALRLHPLLCEGFGADFDGDTMAVHLPLSVEAQIEAGLLMRPDLNLTGPAHGRPTLPSNEIVLGCYYATLAAGDRILRSAFASVMEVVCAHEADKIGYHDFIEVRLPAGTEVVAEDGARTAGRIRTTVGRVLFFVLLGEGMPCYDLPLSRANLGRVLDDGFRRLGRTAMARLLDRIKEFGFHAATRSGLSLGVFDLKEPAIKHDVVARTERAVEELRNASRRGDVREEERYRQTIALWEKAQNEIAEGMKSDLALDRAGKSPLPNPLYLMAQSGARGKWEQVRQLVALRGLMARPSGPRRTVERCITSSLRQGLSMPEFFLSAHGARKSAADKAALPDSGYLTRKLVDVGHSVSIQSIDCGTDRGVVRRAGALAGRMVVENVCDTAGAVLIRAGECITPEVMRILSMADVESVRVRSPLTCAAPSGVCQACYGVDPATGRLAEVGAAVGVVAAQSIGEPGTQLTMKTKHSGGVAGGGSLPGGLDRVAELFEGHRPRHAAVLCNIRGTVMQIVKRGNAAVIRIACDGSDVIEARSIARSTPIVVRPGETVEPGQPLTEGPIDPHELLAVAGAEAVQEHLLAELQAVHHSHGVSIDDRHFEVLLAQMLRKVRVETGGDTGLLPGDVVDRVAFDAANLRALERVRIIEGADSPYTAGQLVAATRHDRQQKALEAAGRRPPVVERAIAATSRPLLLGVTQAAMRTDGFLSAASFQHTRRLLAEAAWAGALDRLDGLKENVMLGRLIPAGTGHPVYHNARVMMLSEQKEGD